MIFYTILTILLFGTSAVYSAAQNDGAIYDGAIYDAELQTMVGQMKLACVETPTADNNEKGTQISVQLTPKLYIPDSWRKIEKRNRRTRAARNRRPREAHAEQRNRRPRAAQFDIRNWWSTPEQRNHQQPAILDQSINDIARNLYGWGVQVCYDWFFGTGY